MTTCVEINQQQQTVIKCYQLPGWKCFQIRKQQILLELCKIGSVFTENVQKLLAKRFYLKLALITPFLMQKKNRKSEREYFFIASASSIKLWCYSELLNDYLHSFKQIHEERFVLYFFWRIALHGISVYFMHLEEHNIYLNKHSS